MCGGGGGKVKSTFITESFTNNSKKQDVIDSMETKRILCDTQVIQGTQTGAGLVGVIETQLQSIAMPSWIEPLRNTLAALGNATEPMQIVNASNATDENINQILSHEDAAQGPSTHN